MTQQPRLGSFITLEGMDGCGKSLAREYLTSAFEKKGMPVVSTYEVGGTPIGKELRAIAFSKRDDEQLDPVSRLLLIYAARMQHIRTVIEPAIRAGTHVITDRFNDSTRVYQGCIDGLNREMDQIEACMPMRMLSSRANYAIYFKVDTAVAYSRGKARTNVGNNTYKNDFEKAERINKAYDDHFLELYKKEPSSVFVVDANVSVVGVNKQLDGFVEMFVQIQQMF